MRMDKGGASASAAVAPVVADSVWQLVRIRAEQTPERVLISDEHDHVLTFGQLREQAETVAAGLFEMGIRPGDVTAWQLPSRIDAVVLFIALTRLGAIQNPLIPMLRENEAGFICDQTRTRLLVVPSVFRGYDHLGMARSIESRLPGMRVINADAGLPAADVSVLPPEPNPSAEESARTARWLFYTSGTTAAPKGAQHTDAGLLAAARTFNTAVMVRADDRTASLSPIAHVGGVLHILSSLMTGSQSIITAIYDPAATTLQMEAAGVTLGGSGVPFIQGYLREQRKRPDHRYFPNVRAFLVGGAPRPPALHYDVQNELGGVGIVSGYGLTECPYVSWARVDDPDDKLSMSEGRPPAATEIRITDAEGKPVPAGESGELRVRAPWRPCPSGSPIAT
jgi:acyl-coenzyme A synthetase/AMP-(fatty) acid ligase